LIDLYLGDAERACARLQTGWRAAKRSMLARIPTVRAELLTLRATATLACGRSAQRDVDRLARQPVAWAPAMARLLGVRDDLEEARGAIAALEEADCHLHAASAKRRLGEALGGGEGARLVEEADRWLVERGVVAPARIAAALVCSFDA
jgi:hypothetical protein